MQLNAAILGSKAGGVGAGLSPKQALAAGLKVDADALPADLKTQLQQGKVDLDDPAVTAQLIQIGAVVGVRIETGTVSASATATSEAETTGSAAATGSAGATGSATGTSTALPRVGITCAFCHSTVDDSFTKGIGSRLDGWPNRDLDVGAVISMSPNLKAIADVLGVDVPTVKRVLAAWGPGKFDAELTLDGKGFRPDGKSAATLIPPAYGLADIHRITYTGDGDDIAYWNRYVAVTQMGGLGTFSDPRLNIDITNGTTDLVSSKLPALQAYQLSLDAPAAPAGSFDAAAAARGKLVFDGVGQCATCHSRARFTDANLTLHAVPDSMAEPESPSYAARSATKLYRTSPLKGVWQHAPYFHDGSAATLEDVGRIYNTKRSLGLSEDQIRDLAQYLRSL